MKTKRVGYKTVIRAIQSSPRIADDMKAAAIHYLHNKPNTSDINHKKLFMLSAVEWIEYFYTWSDTPQGHYFWSSLRDNLNA